MDKVKSILGGVLANLWQVPLAAVIIMTVIALMLSSVRIAHADAPMPRADAPAVGELSGDLPVPGAVQSGFGIPAIPVLSGTRDLLLALMVIASITWHGWRITLRQGAVRQRTRHRIEHLKTR